MGSDPTKEHGASVLWFTGLSGVGKSTIAQRVMEVLTHARKRVTVLDGDVVRSQAEETLGFSRADILKNNARLLDLCRNAEGTSDVVLVAAISPFRQSRELARAAFGSRFFEIFLTAPVEVLEARDTKGLYGRVRRGEFVHLIGVDPTTPYEPPINPALMLETNRKSIDECVNDVLALLERKEKSKEIWCTLGPTSLDPKTVLRFEELGVNLLRINLSHTPADMVKKIVEDIRGCCRIPLCIDTEGAQVRTGLLPNGRLSLEESATIALVSASVVAQQHALPLTPPEVLGQLTVGDVLDIDIGSVVLSVIEVGSSRIKARVLHGGWVSQNKAVTVDRPIALPPFTAKDTAVLQQLGTLGIAHVALSFVHNRSDVEVARALLPADTVITAKVECQEALRNLDGIIAAADAVLLDRGDLSREVPLEAIPRLQKEIIWRAKAAGKRAYVATNLLESMTDSLLPTRAEVSDVYQCLLDGADGLVLAAETAVGNNPVACVRMLRRVLESWAAAASDPMLPMASRFFGGLVEPHGGILVEQKATTTERSEPQVLPTFRVPERVLIDAEQIAVGTYAPLKGFLTREEFEAVLTTLRLPSGLIWPMPVVFQIHQGDAQQLGPGQRVILADERGALHSLLDISEVYTYPLQAAAKHWFGTTDAAHPGVGRLFSGGEYFVAGRVTLLNYRASSLRAYEFTPTQLRKIFQRKGWSKIVGFHSRNIPHRAHEFLQLQALEQTGADGLLISPLSGPRKAGDWTSEIVFASYDRLLSSGIYPAGKVLLAAFATYPRFAGPREAVFTALCRKNMGCSHFIVGRDHSGVGDYYPPEQLRQLFDSLGDLGITPLFFDAVGYDPERQRYGVLGNGVLPISGTASRAALAAGSRLPPWFMREQVQDMVFEMREAGESLFVPEGQSG